MLTKIQSDCSNSYARTLCGLFSDLKIFAIKKILIEDAAPA